MSHNINTYIGRQAAWHKLGTVTNQYQTTADLLNDEGFQYSVFKEQLYDRFGRPVEAWGTFRWDDEARILDLEERAEFLAPVGKGYTVVPFNEGFKTIDTLMQSVDGAHYETAGVLGKGEKVWALANLNLSLTVGAEKSESYLLFSTSFDGMSSHEYRLTTVRVVCQNTLNMALSGKTKSKLTIRHTKNAQNRIDNARLALESISSDVKTVEEKLNFLANRRVNRDTLVSILDRLYPKTQVEDGDAVSSTRRDNILAKVLQCYESNDGNAYPEFRGTAYNLLNAITEYTDHERGTDVESSVFGSGDRLKTQAVEVIYQTAIGMEMVPTKSVYLPTVTTGSSFLDSVVDATQVN